MKKSKIAAVILAAGKGTRMKSSLPKVMHKICGKTMISHVIDSVKQLSPEKIITVIGNDMEIVRNEASSKFSGIKCVIQKEQLGTAHAVMQAETALNKFKGIVLVLYGDTPFIKPDTLINMINTLHNNNKSAAVVLGFVSEDPSSYGRLVLNKSGKLEKIVEYKDANKAEREINLCNSGVMAIRSELLLKFLKEIDNNNAKREYYLTDIVEIARSHKYNCEVIEVSKDEVMGVNSQIERAEAEKTMQDKLRRKAMENGVVMIAPETVFLRDDTEIEAEAVIHPYVIFGEKVKIAHGAEIRSFSHIEGAIIARGAVIGPFARIRPGSEIGEKAHIGNFVEIKKSVIENGAKANHLSYIGDAHIGAEANIGAGAITCNYDGFKKNKTEIGAGAFIGSNVNLVAPLKIGANAIIGAGSTIRKDVASEDMAVNDAPQKNISGKAKSYREKRRK